jgi:hypothetical protein
MKYYIIFVIICACTLVLAANKHEAEHQMQSNQGCCSINIEHVDGGVKVIYDSADDSEDDYIFVEVEYYEEHEDHDVILYELVDEVINMYQETCYHNHSSYGFNIAVDKLDMIQERAMNTDLKDCYNWQEIEVIIFGEIQE